MRKSLWMLVILAGFSASMVWAQEARVTLTESQAVTTALQNQPALRVARADAGMANARVGIARSEGQLQVSVNTLDTLSNTRNVFAVPAVVPQALLQSQNRSSLDLNGMAMLPLYTGGRIQQAICAASFSANAAQDQVAATRVQVAADARARYAAWQQATALQTVAESTVAAQSRNAQVVQQRFEAGKVPKFDTLRAQAELATAKQQLASAQAEVAATRAQLAAALGVPENANWVPAEEALPGMPPKALEAALAARPEVLAAQQNVCAAQAVVCERKAEYSPQVYAVGMVDLFAPPNDGRTLGVTVGVVAGLPVLDAGRRQAEVQEAQEALARAQAICQQVTLQVRAEVSTAEPRASAARQNIDTAQAQVTAAEEAYNVAQERYDAGKSTVVELYDTQRLLTEARQNLVTAQAQYRAALAELYRAMGSESIPATS